MRILQLIVGLEVGGAEMACLRVSRELKKRGHDLTVHCLRSGGALVAEFESLSIPVYSFTALGRARRFHADILQSWMPHANVLSRIYAPLIGASRTVWNVRQTLNRFDDIPFVTRTLIKSGGPLSRGADAIIYNSIQGRTDHEAWGYEPKRGCVIGNGFDRPAFSQEDRKAVRTQLRLADESLGIIFVGRDHPDKGPGFFIDAALELCRQDQNAVFILVGKGFETESARAKAIPLDWASRFRFLGPQSESDVLRLLGAADIFTSTSISEGFSNALAEAMLMACVPVTTDVGDSKRIVNNYGLVIPARDVGAIVTAWLDVLQRAPGDRRALGRKAQAYVEKEYSLSACTDQYEQLYGLLLRGVHEP